MILCSVLYVVCGVCVRVCVYMCVHACVRACVCVCGALDVTAFAVMMVAVAVVV